MAPAVYVAGFDGNPIDQRSFVPNGRFIRAMYRFVVQAGNYVAGGIAVDFTNGGGAPTYPNAMPGGAAPGVAAGPSRVNVAAMGPVASVSATGGTYVLIPGTNPTNWKLKIFVTAGTEYTVGALAADVLTDIIEATADWAR